MYTNFDYFYTMMKFYFNFISSGHGQIEISELWGFDNVPLSITRETGRLGIDTIFAGDPEAKYRAHLKQNHCFELLMYNRDRFGSEAEVQLLIEIGEEINILGEVDFATAETDLVTYIDFTVVQKSKTQVFKRRLDQNVNLLLGEGRPELTNILLLAKPVTNLSTWITSRPFQGIGARISQSSDGEVSKINYGVNPASNQKQYDIEDSLPVSLQPRLSLDSSGYPDLDGFVYINFQENAKRIKIELTNINAFVSLIKSEIGQGTTSLSGFSRLIIRYGFSIQQSTLIELQRFNFNGTTGQNFQFNTQFDYSFDSLPRGTKIWIYLENNINAEFVDPPSQFIRTYTIFNDFQNMDVKITATSVAYDTVIKAIRYRDAIKYAVKSISDLDSVTSPYDEGTEYWNNFITNQSLMRRLEDKPFNITNKLIIEGHVRPETNGDFQIQPDEKVYYKKYEDFYPDILISELDKVVFNENALYLDEEKFVNRFESGYTKYASQKENDQGGSFDIIHADSERVFSSTKAENTLSKKIEFIRDPFYIEEMRRKAYDIKENTATQDDENIVIIDCVPRNGDLKKVETSLLLHQALDANTLILKNDQSFSFLLLGIETGSNFAIIAGENTGSYTVDNVEDTQIQLFRQGGGTVQTFNEPVNTKYQYFIGDSVQYINRTNQGFTIIDNIEDGDNFSNLNFTPRKILLRYHIQQLQTIGMYFDGVLRTTKYIYNGAAVSVNPENYNDLLNESAPIFYKSETITNKKPLLTPYLASLKANVSVKEFFNIINKTTTTGGFLRTYYPNGRICEGYIKQGSFTFKKAGETDPEDMIGTFDLILEEKYNEFDIIIFAADGVIKANNQNISAGFDFSIDENGYVTLYDVTYKQILMTTLYDRIQVNNVKFDNATLLGEVLTQYKP